MRACACASRLALRLRVARGHLGARRYAGRPYTYIHINLTLPAVTLGGLASARPISSGGFRNLERGVQELARVFL